MANSGILRCAFSRYSTFSFNSTKSLYFGFFHIYVTVRLRIIYSKMVYPEEGLLPAIVGKGNTNQHQLRIAI